MLKMILLVYCFLALSLTAVNATDVITLDSSNFEATTQAASGATTGDWLIKFYAPWCGHCKKMQPEFEETARALKHEVNVAEVDVTQNRQLGSRFDIKGFPTLLFLRQGKVIKYQGARTATAMTEFAKGGYADSKHQELTKDVPEDMGYFGEVTAVFIKSYKAALDKINLLFKSLQLSWLRGYEEL